MHWVLWEFHTRADRCDAFEAAYGPDGDWVRLFRRAQGYLGSELLRDAADSNRYLAIDRWRSRADFEAFRARSADRYRKLDRRCAQLTERESALGCWNDRIGTGGDTFESDSAHPAGDAIGITAPANGDRP